MSLGHGANIVRDGLVMHLDAANVKSYPGSGTTWFDVSGNELNATMAGSPSFETTANGVFSFNGVGGRFVATESSDLEITEGTIDTWFNANISNDGFNGIVTKQGAWGCFILDDVLVIYSWGGGGTSSTNINVLNTGWHHLMMTFTETIGSPSNNVTVYLDGVSVLTATITHRDQNARVNIGDGNASQFFGGLISSASIYNRVLNETEVKQNFEALRGRYGI